jgi:hypothetical protein
MGGGPPPWEEGSGGGHEPLWAEHRPSGGAPDEDDEPPTVEQPPSSEEPSPEQEEQPPGESEVASQPGGEQPSDEQPSDEQLPLEQETPLDGQSEHEAGADEPGAADGALAGEGIAGAGEGDHEAARAEPAAGEGALAAGEGEYEAAEGTPAAGAAAPEAAEGETEAGAPGAAEPEGGEEPEGPPWGSGPPPWERGGFWADEEEEEPEAGAAGAGAAATLGTEDLAARRAHQRSEQRRAGQRRLLALIVGLIVLIIVIVVATSGGGSPVPRPPVTTGSAFAHAGTGPSHLAVDIDHSELTENILIADRNNDRLLSISPLGQTVKEMPQPEPSDGSLSSTGHSVFVTQHLQSVVLARRVDNGSIYYHYGHPGKFGSADGLLHDPQTAQETSSGQIAIADRGNCRVLFVTTSSQKPVQTWGTPHECVHHVTSLPMTFAYPSSAFPASNGDIVVTEQNPAWVDILTKNQNLVSAVQLPAGFNSPVGANEYEPNHVIVVDRAHPGKIVEFDFNSSSNTLVPAWRYEVTKGAGELNDPSLARVLSNGDVLVADSGNDRVVVIDPADNRIIWQYGHTHATGSSPGYLHTPDSVALVPNQPPG